MARVLFVCLHNAGRSQMSAALFEKAATGQHAADSAGTDPGHSGARLRGERARDRDRRDSDDDP